MPNERDTQTHAEPLRWPRRVVREKNKKGKDCDLNLRPARPAPNDNAKIVTKTEQVLTGVSVGRRQAHFPHQCLIPRFRMQKIKHRLILQEDHEPDGTWYSMIAVNETLFAIEPNHGELDAISTGGHVRRVADISRVQGHIVPTALAYDGHNFFVGNLDTFPIKDGSSKVMKITHRGEITTEYIGFSIITGLAFDAKGRLYVLENTTGNSNSIHGENSARGWKE
jgi:hypothetical protein